MIRRPGRKSFLSQSLPPPPTFRRRPASRCHPSPNRTIRRRRKRPSRGRRQGGLTGRSQSFRSSSRNRGQSSRRRVPPSRPARNAPEIRNGRGSSSISEPGSRDTIHDPDRLCKVSVPASNRWKSGRRSRPTIGRTTPLGASRLGYYAGRPPAKLSSCLLSPARPWSAMPTPVPRFPRP